MISLNYAKVQPFKIRLPNWLLYPGLPTLQDIRYLTQVGGNCSEYFSQKKQHPGFISRLGLYSRTCDHSLEYLISLHNLVANTHSILEKLGLTHILCYGSLAGQIRIGRSLPWEDGAEMCVFNEDIVKYDEVL